MPRPSPHLFAALLSACAADAPPAADPAPQHLADLDAAGRRALCGRIVAAQRGACDPEMRSFDVLLIDRCVAEHPRWSCPTLRVDDHERCTTTRDPAACAAAEQQARACALDERLRERCPLHVGSVVEGGPAARAGLVAGDRVRAVDGAPLGHGDLQRLLDVIAAAERPLRLTVESAAGTRDVAVSPDSVDGRRRIGAAFTPPPACVDFLAAPGPLPCRVE